MIARLYHIRFELFLATQITILFGSLVVPALFFENVLEPILFLSNLATGVLLLSKLPKFMWFCISLLVINSLALAITTFFHEQSMLLEFVRVGSYFLFYLIVTVEIIRQIWDAKKVSKNVIFGLTSGYLSLGLLGFFICLGVEMVYPHSFDGGLLAIHENLEIRTEQLMYYSFVTLMTIGYGDILPMTDLAQKASLLIGLVGQFYMVIITAVVVGKFINQRNGY